MTPDQGLDPHAPAGPDSRPAEVARDVRLCESSWLDLVANEDLLDRLEGPAAKTRNRYFRRRVLPALIDGVERAGRRGDTDWLLQLTTWLTNADEQVQIPDGEHDAADAWSVVVPRPNWDADLASTWLNKSNRRKTRTGPVLETNIGSWATETPQDNDWIFTGRWPAIGSLLRRPGGDDLKADVAWSPADPDSGLSRCITQTKAWRVLRNQVGHGGRGRGPAHDDPAQTLPPGQPCASGEPEWPQAFAVVALLALVYYADREGLTGTPEPELAPVVVSRSKPTRSLLLAAQRCRRDQLAAALALVDRVAVVLLAHLAAAAHRVIATRRPVVRPAVVAIPLVPRGPGFFCTSPMSLIHV